mmetsp:Transcript_71090/g.211946  ORF Transcript_71090/g.211946 Transcript_71090/m.211946 type:complete len:596 (-) Transcript_71090:108-1895(-)
MINVQAVANYLASASTGGSEDRALIASLLSIANALAAQQGNTAAAAAAAATSTQPAALASSTALVPRTAAGISLDAAIATLDLQPEMETLAEGIKLFVQRYPIDTRAYEYLVTSAPTVVAHVLRDFRPPHEGESDYSRLLTTYVKRIRAHYQGVGDLGGTTAHPVIGPSTAPGSMLSNWRPTGGGSAATGVLASQQAADKIAEVDLVEAVQVFVQKYPADDRAYNLLVNASPGVQLRVLREFRPHRQGDSDYSALLTTFTKKCIDQEAQGAAVAQQPASPCHALALPMATVPAVVPADLTTAMTTPGLDVFLQRYPIDERAYNFFAVSSPEVQQKVLREFQPMHEGEQSYSKLFTAFLNKCRAAVATTGAPVDALPALDHVRVSEPASALQALLDRGAAAADTPAAGEAARGALAVRLPEQAGEALDLEEFRLRFPMDDRAFDFLATAPREVQERVLETFVPQRLDDTDFSAPVTAYVRSLRNQLSDTNTAPGVTEESVARFFERYPCDARAQDYFHSCMADVQAQVMREFRPRSEGDSDYSAAVTAFIKKCKMQSREAANNGSWTPLQQQLGNWRPPLRPPAGGWGPSKRPRLS